MISNDPTLLVLGATGKTGRRVADRLEARGRAVRRASRLGTPSFDWRTPSTWAANLHGIDAAYLAYPSTLPIDGATEHIAAFVEQARTAGVRRLVLLTGRGEAEGLRQERLVQDSGLSWTVLRSAWFDQNFTEGAFADLVSARQFVLPAGDVPEPFVDLDDLAEVAAAALVDPSHDGQVYDVTGPRLLTFREVVAALGHALATPIRFVDVSHADFLAGLRAEGTPADAVGLLDFLFGTLLDGRNAHLGDGVQRALGRPPTDFATFARREVAAGSFGEVTA
jgi:uncharacterized protein YbjT (DUF2867 family)